jgi:hypothetical protein
MAITLPDEIEHGNPVLAIVDSENLRGGLKQVSTFTNIALAAAFTGLSDKFKIGTEVIALDTNSVYTYIGPDITNITSYASSGGGGITDLTGEVTATGPGSATAIIATNIKIGGVGCYITGQGTTITTGFKGIVVIPYSMTVTSWHIVSYNGSGAALSGSIVVDVYRNGTSMIGAGNKPTLSSSSDSSANVSGWTSTTITLEDIIMFKVDSVTTCKEVSLTIKGTKSA